MVAKAKTNGEKAETRRLKVGKLQLKKETVKALTPSETKQVRAGAGFMTKCSYRDSGCN